MDKAKGFKEWLNENRPHNSDMLMSTLRSIDEYAQKTKKIGKSILEIDNIKDFNKVVNALKGDKFFRIKSKMSGKVKENEFIFKIYSDYLKLVHTQEENVHKFEDKEINESCVKEEENNLILLSNKAIELLKNTPVISFSVTQIAEYCNVDRDTIKHFLDDSPWAIETKNSFYQYKNYNDEDNNITKIINCNNFVDFTNNSVSYSGTQPIYLKICEKEVKTKNWTDLYVNVCNTLLNKDECKANQLLKDKPLLEGSTRIYFDTDTNRLTAPKQLSNGYFSETNFSANDIVQNTYRLLKRFGFNESDIEIRYIFKSDIFETNKMIVNTKTCYYCCSRQNEFLNWLLISKNLANNSANNYSSAVKTAGEFIVEHSLYEKHFYEIDDDVEAKRAIDILMAHREFREYNKEQHNRFSAALKKYVEFVARGDELYEVSTKLVCDYSKFEEILSDKFPLGFKIGSPIDNNKFRRFYNDAYGEEVQIGNKELESILIKIGIEYEYSRIMAPSNTIDKKLLDKVLDYISDVFNDGISLLYYKAIFKEYESELLNTNIYNEKILKQVLNHFCGNEYFLKRYYLTNDKNIEVDPCREVREIIINAGIPMSYEEIEDEILHIPLSKIKFILASNNEFINTERSYYTHVNCIDITEDDLFFICNFIDKEITNKGYCIREDIYKQSIHILDKNEGLTILGFGNVLSYFLKSLYDCNGTIFSPLGENLNYMRIFANYCKDKNIILTRELENFSKELGFNSLPSVYLKEVFDDFSQVSHDTLVHKKNLCFDVKKTDAIIRKFCKADYIPFSYINTFSLMPSCDYHWNEFLLKAYVKDFSAEYFYLGETLSIIKCVGAIVERNSGIDNFDKILEDALSYASFEILSDEKTSLNYLCENGFIAKRRMGNINTIMTHARNLKDKRGN